MMILDAKPYYVAADVWVPCATTDALLVELMRHAAMLRFRSTAQRNGEDALLLALSDYPAEIQPTAEQFQQICDYKWREPLPESVGDGDRETALADWPDAVLIKDELYKRADKLRKRGVSQRDGEALLTEAVALRLPKVIPDEITSHELAELCNWRWSVDVFEEKTAEKAGLEHYDSAGLAALLSDRPPMVIAGLLPVGGSAMFVAEPKQGKTLFALLLAVCVSEGKPFLGHDVEQGAVVFACSDSFWNTAARVVVAMQNLKHVYFVPHVRDIVRQKEDVSALIASLSTKGPPVKLLVMDTYDSSRQHSGAGAYQAADADAEAFFAAIHDLGDRHKLATVVTHHVSKGSTSGTGKGSQTIGAKSDLTASVSKSGDTLTLSAVFSRWGQSGEAIGTARLKVVADPKGGPGMPVLEAIESADATIEKARRQGVEDMRLLLTYLQLSVGPRPTVKEISLGVGKRTGWVSAQVDLAAGQNLIDGWKLTEKGTQLIGAQDDADE
jgi:hypothetical protein